MVQALEGDEEEAYADQLTPETAAIAADEREHAAIWRELQGNPRPAGIMTHSMSRTGQEAWHRGSRSGTLRAAVFGANDGLVSNLSLVMGVAGALSDNHFIVLAGIAGLLAGAFSMAAGEYISMQSQREVFERQIAVEREEMRVMPDVEERELAQIYRNKGLPKADAERVAAHLMEDPVIALDTKVREELGLDPDELGSPWGAATSSFIAFAIGAVIPLTPFLLGVGLPALVSALGLSFAALFLVGAGVSVFTGRSLLFSGARQVAIGAAAAAVTYVVGTLIGANVA
jgi:VIT1/CCC1 family predicted Fe2+/Mn2+ transporter